jgi:hypothetical protein
MDEKTPFGLGAEVSPYDSRTFVHDTTMAFPLVKGGQVYTPVDMENQHVVGICTAISLIQNAEKVLGKKFSPDFQYLLQKKFYDLNWVEGSSIFNALKVGKNIGFLPKNLFPYITEEDRKLAYPSYVAKLEAISDSEIQRLIGLCTDKLIGYAQVPTDPQSLAKGIIDSCAGILCRYNVGEEWWTASNGISSWATKDIDPIRPPKVVVSGHAIGASYFDFSVVKNITHPNTWGTSWNDQNQGNCHIVQDNYQCTEAWIPYYETIPAPAPKPYIFTQDMKFGQTSEDVKQLQLRLISLGYAIPSGATKYYGYETKKAVLQYQINNISLSWYERYFVAGRTCGPKTRAKLNSSFV